MILVRRRPWKLEDDAQLRQMAGAGKSILMIAHQLKRTVMAVRGRASIIGVPIRQGKRKANRWNDLAEDFCGLARDLTDIATYPSGAATRYEGFCPSVRPLGSLCPSRVDPGKVVALRRFKHSRRTRIELTRANRLPASQFSRGNASGQGNKV
jgi:hypothetical protein